jgi:hypothetical protein
MAAWARQKFKYKTQLRTDFPTLHGHTVRKLNFQLVIIAYLLYYYTELDIEKVNFLSSRGHTSEMDISIFFVINRFGDFPTPSIVDTGSCCLHFQ